MKPPDSFVQVLCLIFLAVTATFVLSGADVDEQAINIPKKFHWIYGAKCSEESRRYRKLIMQLIPIDAAPSKNGSGRGNALLPRPQSISSPFTIQEFEGDHSLKLFRSIGMYD